MDGEQVTGIDKRCKGIRMRQKRGEHESQAVPDGVRPMFFNKENDPRNARENDGLEPEGKRKSHHDARQYRKDAAAADLIENNEVDSDHHGRYANEFNQVSHGHEGHYPEHGKQKSAVSCGFLVGNKQCGFIAEVDGQHGIQSMEEADNEHFRLRVNHADFFKPEKQRVMQPRVDQTPDIVPFVYNGQGPVEPLLRDVDNAKMVVVHAVSLGENHGEHPE